MLVVFRKVDVDSTPLSCRRTKTSISITFDGQPWPLEFSRNYSTKIANLVSTFVACLKTVCSNKPKAQHDSHNQIRLNFVLVCKKTHSSFPAEVHLSILADPYSNLN